MGWLWKPGVSKGCKVSSSGLREMKIKSFLIAFCILPLLFFIPESFAEEKIFLREYIYQAGEMDSKISCRTVSLEQVKRLLLEELGTYLESHTEIRNLRLTKDQVVMFSAGIVRVQMVEESWDGNDLKYRLKARMTANPEHVAKSIDTLRRNHLQARALEEVEKKVSDLLKENERLKEELRSARKNLIKIAQYNKNIEELNIHETVMSGWELSLSGMHHDALRELNKAIERNPNCELAYAVRGGIYAKLGDHQKAIEDCTRAIELDPKSALAYAMRGYIHFRLQDFEKVFADSNRAIELDPRFASAYVLRATVHAFHMDYQKHLADNNMAVELDPRMAVAYANRANAYRHLGRVDLASQDARKAVDVDPRCPEAYLARGWESFLNGKHDKALKDFNKAIELDPGLIWAYFHRGILHRTLKDYRPALEDFDKAIELNPRYAAAYEGRAKTREAMGDEDLSIKDFKTAAKLGLKSAQDHLKEKGMAW
jgi:tetratricopeptide (TPR) repeat protein